MIRAYPYAILSGHMKRSFPRVISAGVPLTLAIAACACATRAPARAGVQHSGPPPYTAADVRFMSGMIGHHAQAVLMAGWAPTHGASEAVRTLCERMVVSQRDEIALMQRWLRERNDVPDADPSHGHAMSHSTLMPGMLTVEQLAELDRARGPEFDRLFLTFMIQHHHGAIKMVEELFGTTGAARDGLVFQFAADLNADQITEIDRMNRMLVELSPGGK